jgi:hypothetical protein
LVESFLDSSREDIGKSLEMAYKNGEYSPTEMQPFFLQCVQQIDTFSPPQNADSVVLVCGLVAHWSGVFLRLLETRGAASPLVNSTICRSTLQALTAIINFLTGLCKFQSENEPVILPVLSVADEVHTSQLVDFIIRICFAVFEVFPTKKK